MNDLPGEQDAPAAPAWSSPAAPLRPRPWMILPAAAGGVIAALLALTLTSPRESVAVSEVIREVREIVLRKADRPGREDGGPLGTWWLAAGSIDDQTGEFRDFRMRGGSLHLAARRAELVVDPEANAISFNLRDVVFASLPDAPAADRAEPDERALIHLDRYMLGPMPFRRRIAADEQAGAPRGHRASAR